MAVLDPIIKRMVTTAIRVTPVAFAVVLWTALILEFHSRTPGPGAGTVVLVLSGVSAAVYFLIRGRRHAIGLSMLIAYSVAVLSVATFVMLLRRIYDLQDWIEFGLLPWR
ncbi:hypothetical protein Pan44_26150 [Caulifigura coniformis]|uniref:Uncharacterized protein n=2 Tax=Caulifigura coniformis TaxID=2527983 RepID=A0A517SEM0_9PLAN|nr:hypothetical protein Pan44_26150 [Caulifigura coniformis]